MSSFESATDEVAETIYEVRKYPLVPEGVFDAICCKAEVKPANPKGQFYKEGDKNIHLHWQIQSPTYLDDEQKERHYRVFSRPYACAYGERSNIGKLMMKLTGHPPIITTEPIKIPMAGGKFKDAKRVRFDQKMIESMVCKVVIEHQEYPPNSGEMRPNIVNYMVSADQKRTNYQQLPLDGRGAMKDEATGADAAEEVFEEQPEEKPKSGKLKDLFEGGKKKKAKDGDIDHDEIRANHKKVEDDTKAKEAGLPW